MTFISALYEPVRCIKPNWAPSLCCMQPKYRKNFAVRRPLDFKKLISNLVPASTGRKKRKYRNFLGYDSHTNLSACTGVIKVLRMNFLCPEMEIHFGFIRGLIGHPLKYLDMENEKTGAAHIVFASVGTAKLCNESWKPLLETSMNEY